MEQSYKNIYDYIEIFYRRKWMLIIPMLLGTMIAAFIAYTLPPYYHSSTLILVEQQQVPEGYVIPTDTTPMVQRLNTISQQIMSRTNLEKIITDFNLYKGGAKDNPLAKILGWFGQGKITKPLKEDLIESMKKGIEIKVIGGSGGKGGDAFSISYGGENPYITMQVTNALASLFIEENLKIREEYVEGTSEFLVNELGKAKQELEEQEKAIRMFKEKYIGSLPQQLEANLRTLDRLQLELQSVDASLKNAEDRKFFWRSNSV